MNKIKSIAYASIAAVLAFPALALAQFTPQGVQDPGVVGLNTGLASNSFYGIIRNMLMYLLGIIGVLAVVGFVIAGIMYITAAGDEDRVENAKKMLTYSIIGLAVALLGLVILVAIDFIII